MVNNDALYIETKEDDREKLKINDYKVFNYWTGTYESVTANYDYNTKHPLKARQHHTEKSHNVYKAVTLNQLPKIVIAEFES
ncbi:uncharacterized protein LOC143199686 isoform X2 [Rhynchophorus ferrugineus]|uniref:Uncharacterized protein n=1 Tax=Rhynchophorus ferrugineus TaxID=354439 RepID=A0A834M1V2_RHYFE|nr:hypothetical protein GWI33_018949 [Rhynchophorus ferrugineus]